MIIHKDVSIMCVISLIELRTLGGNSLNIFKLGVRRSLSNNLKDGKSKTS